MAKLILGMNQSLDGYVDHTASAPSPVLFRHWIEQVRGLAGSIYGRRVYEVMRYWEDEHPEWDAAEREFADAWRSKPKWVMSRSLKDVGPNATLVSDNVEAVVRGLRQNLSARSMLPARNSRTASPRSGSSTSIASTSTRSCWGGANPSSPVPALRSA